MKKATLFVFLFSVMGVVGACLQDPTGVPGGSEMEVSLHVTGGFAGADYAVLLDGEARQLVGVSCVNLCDFQEGEVLLTLSVEQVEYVRGLFQDADIYGLDGEDFGTQCCDQFHFDVDYRDGVGRGRVKGSSEVLPQGLKVAVATLQGMISGTLPVIVAFDTHPSSWPGDPYQIQHADVRAPGPGEMGEEVGDGASDDAAPDDEDIKARVRDGRASRSSEHPNRGRGGR